MYCNFLFSFLNKFKIAEKKKKQKKEAKEGVSIPALEEEGEEGYKHAVWVLTMKLFADMERRR